MKLIDKDALVAEIEEQIEFGKFKCQQSQENGDQESYIAWSEHIATCGKILSFIDTLEVKEVDLNDEKCKDLNDDGTCMYAFNKTGKIMRCENINCSRKIKAQKGE